MYLALGNLNKLVQKINMELEHPTERENLPVSRDEEDTENVVQLREEDPERRRQSEADIMQGQTSHSSLSTLSTLLVGAVDMDIESVNGSVRSNHLMKALTDAKNGKLGSMFVMEHENPLYEPPDLTNQQHSNSSEHKKSEHKKKDGYLTVRSRFPTQSRSAVVATPSSLRDFMSGFNPGSTSNSSADSTPTDKQVIFSIPGPPRTVPPPSATEAVLISEAIAQPRGSTSSTETVKPTAQPSTDPEVLQSAAAFITWSDYQRDQFLRLILPTLHLPQIHMLSHYLAPHVLPHLSPSILSMMKDSEPMPDGLGASNLSLNATYPFVQPKRPSKATQSRVGGGVFTPREIIEFIILNKTDMLKWLPTEISLRILERLDPISLARCGMVNRTWRQLAGAEYLWKNLFLNSRWSWGITDQTITEVMRQVDEVKQAVQMRAQKRPGMDVEAVMSIAVGRVWKYWFRERFRIRRNWERGNCSVRTFEGHSQGVACLQFNDNYIISGSSDHTLKLWALRTNTHPIQTLRGHTGTVRCLHFDMHRVISGSNDRTLRVWDIDPTSRHYGECIGILTGHNAPVRCLQTALLPKWWVDQQNGSEDTPVFYDSDPTESTDHTLLVSGSYDCTIKIWQMAIRPPTKNRTVESRMVHRCLRTLQGHTGAVLCIQFDVGDWQPDGSSNAKLVSGSADCTIRLWDPATGDCLRVFPGHLDAVTCLQFDTTKIISGSLDSSLKFWNILTGECEDTIDWMRGEGHRGVVRNLKFDKRLLISSSDDKTIKVWELADRNKFPGGLKRMLTLKRHTDGVTCLQFDYKMIVSGSYDKTIKLWDFSAP